MNVLAETGASQSIVIENNENLELESSDEEKK